MTTTSYQPNFFRLRFDGEGAIYSEAGIPLALYRCTDGNQIAVVQIGGNTSMGKREHLPVHQLVTNIAKGPDGKNVIETDDSGLLPETPYMGHGAVSKTVREVEGDEVVPVRKDVPTNMVYEGSVIELRDGRKIVGKPEDFRPEDPSFKPKAYIMVFTRYGVDELETKDGASIITEGYTERNGSVSGRISLVCLPYGATLTVNRRHNDQDCFYDVSYDAQQLVISDAYGS